MSDDRLEKALAEMREEPVDATALEAARVRVWNELASVGDGSCAEFRPDLGAYLSGALGGSRRLLLEDHLSRCTACRASLAELRGPRRVVAMPQRAGSRRKPWVSLVAAAAVLLMALYAGRERIDALMAPAGPRATVVSANGSLYRLAGDALAPGAAIGEGELVRTGPGARAVLQLADGSTVDVNERTELFATAAWSGLAIHLERGDVIVTAAKQRRGHLRVLTRDSIASVKGTVFAVSAGLGGSVVSVVEGSVAVRQPGTDVLLKPGEQAASNAAFASSVAQAVAWSPEAEHYLELLSSFVKIERQLAERFPTGHRTSSALLPYLPGDAFAYGAIPNLRGRIGEALILADQQSSENGTFAAWWNSETGRVLRQMVERIQSVSGMLGDEIVFSASSTASGGEIPMVIARVQPGKRTELARGLDGLFVDAGEPALPYSLSDELMVVSDSQPHLAWGLSQLGRGAGSPFAKAIGERYRRGAGWLVGIDAPAVIAMSAGDDAPPIELASMIGVKYVFVEQRAPAGAEENEVTLMFEGTRSGMGAWLANAGSGGAAEYLPADALFAGYASTREPTQLFQEFAQAVTKADPSFAQSLAEVDGKLGAGFITSLTAALGTEAAVAVNGVSVTGPRWVLAALAYNASGIDSSIQKFADAVNAELAADKQDAPLVLRQESAGDRVWSTLTGGGLPFGVTWTYDRGYLVAASDRGTAEHAIATRNDGSPLIWTQSFRSQLPASAGLHPSAFVWLNTKGALGQVPMVDASPAMTRLLAERDPMLVVFDVKPDQIHAASRTRLTSVILDALALESLDSRINPAPGSNDAVNDVPVIELENLKVRLGGGEILRGISCRLGTSGVGKAVGLLGPNGAGKSTLIQTLVGFLRPSAGHARILGFDCRHSMSEVRSRVGYMPENDSFIGEMTAVAFVRQMAELSGLPPEAALEKAHEVLFHVGLGEARYRELRTYSYGMKQMAKLAQAIVHGPELVILDEPTNGLDPAARRRMLTLIREMKEDQGMSVLVCSHLLRDIEQVCDDVVILKDGLVVQHCNLEADRRSNRRFVELEVSGDDGRFRAALPEIGADGVSEGGGRWRIVLPAGVELEAIWGLAARQNLLVRKLTHRRDTLEEIFLKAMGHLTHTPGEAAALEIGQA